MPAGVTRMAAVGPVEGVYPLCKPPGMTSHDVVAAARGLIGVRHTGHAGTLDPAAAGVLVLLVGPGPARLSEYLLDLPKTYLADFHLGRETDTQDYTGRVTAEAPEEMVARVGPGDIAAALAACVGEIDQIPPMVSAVQVGGERLYELARRGRDVPREPRRVVIHALSLLAYRPPVACVRVVCSSGTYVRTLAHDVGRRLGVGAMMGFLVRETIGPFRLEACCTLEELREAAHAGRLGTLAIPPADAIAHLPAVTLAGVEAERLRRGETVSIPASAGLGEAPAARVLSEEGELLAVAALSGGRVRPRKVLMPLYGGWRKQGADTLPRRQGHD